MANEEQGLGYEPKLWKIQDPLTEGDMNHIENGIKNSYDTLNKYFLGRSTKQLFNIGTILEGHQLWKDGTQHKNNAINCIISDLIRIEPQYNYKLGYINNNQWRAAVNDSTNGRFFGYVLYNSEQEVIPEPGEPTTLRQFIKNPADESQVEGEMLIADSTETVDGIAIKNVAKYVRFCAWTSSTSEFDTGVPDQLVFCTTGWGNITEFEPFYTIKDEYFITNHTYTNKVNQIDSQLNNLDSTLDDLTNETIYEINNKLDTKADQNGAYSELTAGQLMTSNNHVDNTVYSMRQTYEDENTYYRVKEEAIIGGTIIWNQIVQEGNFSRTDNSWPAREKWVPVNAVVDATASSNNNYVFLRDSGESIGGIQGALLQDNLNLRNNDIYLTLITVTASAGAKVRLYGPGTQFRELICNGNATRIGVVNKLNTSQAENYPRIMDVSDVGQTNAIAVKDCNVFNLTRMFGSSVANNLYNSYTNDVNFAVKWFRQLFPNYFYPQNAGEMLSVNLSARIATGFNLFNKNNVKNGITRGNGNYEENIENAYTSDELIPIFPGVVYYYNYGKISGGANWNYPTVIFYDGQKRLVSYTDSNRVTTPQTACYCRINVPASDIDTASIHVDIPGKETAYEPYVPYYRYSLDDSKILRGVPYWLNGRMVYDGDIYTSDGQISRKYAYLNLDTIPENYWQHTSLTNTWTYHIGDIANNAKVLGTGNFQINNKTLEIKSESKPTGKLIYELETSAIIPDHGEPYTAVQNIISGGTEGYLDAQVEAGERGLSVPAGHISYYQIDLRGQLETLIQGPKKLAGTEVIINGIANERYQCGVLDSLTIYSPTKGIIDIIFTTNETQTLLTASGVVWPGIAEGESPSLQPNTTYELNIMDGKYGVMIAWPPLQN